MVEEAKIKEEGGALEVKVDGNKEITIIHMVARYVAKQGTMLMSVIITSQMIQ